MVFRWFSLDDCLVVYLICLACLIVLFIVCALVYLFCLRFWCCLRLWFVLLDCVGGRF